MIKNKKQMFVVIGAFVLVMLLTTVTYAFFNYTRTGVANRIQVGRIYFNTLQNGNINLTNMFPIEATPANLSDNTKVGMVTIDITGDTTYDNGVEYLVSAVDVNNTINSKSLPISINVSYGEASDEDVGLEDEEYFDNRGGNSSIYKVLAKDTISNNDQLIVGYIAKGSTGIDGTITIKAYLDKSKILISDTYPSGDVTHTEASGETSVEVIDYTNGTPNSMAEGKTVFTTSEWNQLQANGVSFKVKVEANEGLWVEENRSVNVMINFFNTGNDIEAQKTNIKEVYFKKMGATRMQNTYDAATIKEDLTDNGEGKVLAWLEENPLDNTKYNLIIASDGDTYISDATALFYNWTNVEKFEFVNLNLSRTTAMEAMFSKCSSLVSIDLSNMGGDNISSSMSSTFYGCTNLQEINMSGFNFGSAQLHAMFSNLTNLHTVNLKNANTSRVTSMSPLFAGDTSLTSIDLSGLGGDYLTNVSGMFGGCTNLREINMSEFNFGTASLSALFANSSSIEVIDLSNVIFNTTDLSAMFVNATSLRTIYVSNTWNVDNIASSDYMFTNCTSLVGGSNTSYDANNPSDKTYAHVDGGQSNPGYFTLKTN